MYETPKQVRGDCRNNILKTKLYYYFFSIVVLILSIISLSSCKDTAVNLLAAGDDVYVGCWYNDNVLIFEGTDTTHGKRILDYNSAEGQAFAQFNKINYQDTNYDFKAKYRSMLALPELASEHHPIIRSDNADKPAEGVQPAEKSAVTLDKTKLPTYSARDKSKKANTGKKAIPEDRMPNYDKVYGSAGSGDKQPQQGTPANTESPERAAVGAPSVQAAQRPAANQPQPTAAGGQAVPANPAVPDGTDKSGQPVRSADRSKVQDTINISDVQVGEVVMDATLDALYRQQYIIDTHRIAELNTFRDELDNALLAALRTQFDSYGGAFVTDPDVVDEQNTRLLFDIVKYRPGEFNLIKNISSKMAIQFRIINPKYNVDTTFRGDFSCEASSYYPNERARLMEISRKIAEYLQLKLSLIKVKDLKTIRREPAKDATDDTTPKKPLPPGSADIPDDEKIVPINESIHRKGLKSAGRDD